MKREDIKLYLVIAIGIGLIILTITFVAKLLPLIIVILIGLLIYDSYKKQREKPIVRKKEKKIKEAEIIEEKNN